MTFIDEVKSTHSLRKLSETTVDGYWKKIPGYLDRRPRDSFIPTTFEGAKRFLKETAEALPNMLRPAIRVQQFCHGCHGPLGEGAHIGSAVGKLRCTFTHSSLCKGNIVEDESWRACPRGYV